MSSRLIIAGVALVGCLAAFVAINGLVATGLPVGFALMVACSVTLFLAAAAAAFAWRAMRRASAVHAEMRQFATSVDMTLRTLASRSDQDAATVNELNRSVARQTDALKIVARQERTVQGAETLPETRTATVVDHPALRRGAAPAEAAMPGGIESDLVKAVAERSLQLSLEPIVSLSRGAAAGFEVHAHFGSDEAPVNIRRLSADVPGLDAGEFERQMVIAAVNAARRQLGDAGKSMPLHVAISEALLGGPVDKVIELFDRHPECADAIVLSVPAALLDNSAHRTRLDRLAATNVGLAIEDWPAGRGKADRLKGTSARFVKLTADRLLDRRRQPRGAPAGQALVEAATQAGATLIATGVRSDEDAVALLDFGIDLMNGERLSGPRRLRAETAQGSAGRSASG